MAERRTQKSSLNASIERAKKIGASVEETERIHSVVSANTTSDIKSFEVTFDHDSSDNLAVWIKLFVDKNLASSKEKIDELNRTTTNIRSKLLDEKISFWPYVVIRSSS
jgi:hypothetical protein